MTKPFENILLTIIETTFREVAIFKEPLLNATGIFFLNRLDSKIYLSDFSLFAG
jgi:hypothetical protein